jgi:4-hydroxy-3-polyprenylbenzoate decarboxylase
LHDQGVVILPAMMTFYHKPKSVQDMINQLTGKILSQYQIPFSDYSSWEGMDNDHIS